MIADDIKFNRVGMTLILKKIYNFNIIEVQNGLEAFNKYINSY